MSGLILFVGMMLPTAIGVIAFATWLFSDNKKSPTTSQIVGQTVNKIYMTYYKVGK